MFFDFEAGIVRHPFISYLSGLNIDLDIHEWSSWFESTADEMRKLGLVGLCCYELNNIVMRLQDVEISEIPETYVHLDYARSALSLITLHVHKDEDVS